MLNQIVLINKVDCIMSRYYGDGITRINSRVGKRLESIKVHMCKLRIDLRKREKKKNLNFMDKFLLETGEKILIQGEESIRLINEIDYLNIIKRSMKENEICLGKVGEENLKEDKKIEIGSLRNVSYNLREEDIYEYLKRAKKKQNLLREDYYIDEFVNLARLTNVSKEYIKILLRVPSDSLKQWYRYSQGKRNVSPDKYLESIKSTLVYEIKNIKKGD
ncbi:hypothetical protein [Clostridium sp. HBUAS56017]|uniref:hypothetical protein n=1 Tax=Clostridium sp. HBUAS56017 TaxID=2571128 RepID=UPI001177342E|nr:hypothetical protein [Clostridium sp. HBUAS56017]